MEKAREYKMVAVGDIELSAQLRPDKALVSSVERIGIMSPILVMETEYDKEEERAKYVVVDGNRRLAAAKAIGHDEVPVMEVSGEVDALVLSMNNLRSQNPYTELDAFRSMRSRMGDDDIRKATGLSAADAKKFDGIASLHDVIRTSFLIGNTSLTAAVAASKCDDEQQAQLARYIGVFGKITGDDVKKVIYESKVELTPEEKKKNALDMVRDAAEALKSSAFAALEIGVDSDDVHTFVLNAYLSVVAQSREVDREGSDVGIDDVPF